MSANTPPTKKPEKSLVKRLLSPFSGRKHKKNSANIAASASQPNLAAGREGLSRVSSSGVSTTSEPTQGQVIGQVPTQDQGNQITGSPSVPAAATVQLSAASEDQVLQPDYNYFKLAGAVLEKSVFTLKNLSELIPVPGLGPAVSAVCACIEHFHKISENKEKLEELTSEIASKSQALQKHWSQNVSPHMDEEYRKLAE
ncbi:hypothetical protein VKT23_014775 [Stygiomarasmius scandens]|uniref:Uncharacterized protein n=1 Tax=Marasmiellus scandens TaxID=2682957 RepID=A0ABR1J261_9AGAR